MKAIYGRLESVLYDLKINVQIGVTWIFYRIFPIGVFRTIFTLMAYRFAYNLLEFSSIVKQLSTFGYVNIKL